MKGNEDKCHVLPSTFETVQLKIGTAVTNSQNFMSLRHGHPQTHATQVTHAPTLLTSATVFSRHAPYNDHIF